MCIKEIPQVYMYQKLIVQLLLFAAHLLRRGDGSSLINPVECSRLGPGCLAAIRQFRNGTRCAGCPWCLSAAQMF